MKSNVQVLLVIVFAVLSTYKSLLTGGRHLECEMSELSMPILLPNLGMEPFCLSAKASKSVWRVSSILYNF